jgi:hypothetical protein
VHCDGFKKLTKQTPLSVSVKLRKSDFGKPHGELFDVLQRTRSIPSGFATYWTTLHVELHPTLSLQQVALLVPFHGACAHTPML